jgi:hypothetical protein
VLDEKFQRLPIVKIIDELTVRTREWKSEPVDDPVFPKTPQSALRHVFIPTDQPYQLRRGGEAVTQNRLDTVKVPITGGAAARSLRLGKF